MRSIRILAACAVLALFVPAAAQTPPALEAGAPAPGARQFQNRLIGYAVFQRDISELASATIESEASLDEALERIARHNSEALVRGWTTYGAGVAAQSPTFVAGAREAAARMGKDAAVSAIAGDPARARGFRGADEAEAAATRALAADAARVTETADLFDGYARTLQHRPWASAEASGQAERVQRLRDLGGARGFTPTLPMSFAPRLTIAPASVRASESGDTFGGAHFWDALFGEVSRPKPVVAAAVLQNGAGSRRAARDGLLSLAALQAIDAGQTAAADTYTRDASAVSCVEMARLQFYQCLSAVRYVYENAYCAARHGLREVASCMSAALSRSLASETAISSAAVELPQMSAETASAPAEAAPEAAAAAAEAALAGAPEAASQPAVAADTGDGAFRASLDGLGAGELFARADELEEQGDAAKARAARRTLIARFPDSPLALVAARQLSGER